MKWNIAIPVVVVLVVVLGAVGAFAYLYLKGGTAQSTDTTPVASTKEKLAVSPQDARTSVTVDSATLTQASFLVVRGGDGRRIGQVIEISQYLTAGEYENIKIEFGDFYTYSADDRLVVMIYRDDGDQLFNELDEPINSTAVFVETGESVPPSVFEEQVAPQGGTGMATVRYTNTGFQPAKLTVPAGTMVEFINQSDTDMWVASNVHPEHLILPTFDQFKGVAKGKSYMYTFEKKGSWSYHDHINPALGGVITVE